MKPAKKVVEILKAQGLMLATAESCTGGMLSKAITDISGSSSVFLGGVCAYHNNVKKELLEVENETLLKHGAVSEKTAIEMAKGVKKLFKSTVGVSITGIAGPNSDQSEKPVGLIYICVCKGDTLTVKKLETGTNSRSKNRKTATDEALNMLLEILE